MLGCHYAPLSVSFLGQYCEVMMPMENIKDQFHALSEKLEGILKRLIDKSFKGFNNSSKPKLRWKS